MNNKVFRRDEIWFACKNENKESEIYSLYEIRDENGDHIRANAAFYKQYLEGKYGADPYLENMLNWEDVDVKKPTKISDIDKQWALNARKDRRIKSKLEYHLIICEGTQTEPNYF